MSRRFGVVLHDNIEVEIQDENYKKIGDAPSLRKAAKDCYLSNTASIWRYLYIGNKVREKRAIKSKVTGIKYRFKLKKDE